MLRQRVGSGHAPLSLLLIGPALVAPPPTSRQAVEMKLAGATAEIGVYKESLHHSKQQIAQLQVCGVVGVRGCAGMRGRGYLLHEYLRDEIWDM